jgi:hypothetical protein
LRRPLRSHVEEEPGEVVASSSTGTSAAGKRGVEPGRVELALVDEDGVEGGGRKRQRVPQPCRMGAISTRIPRGFRAVDVARVRAPFFKDYRPTPW